MIFDKVRKIHIFLLILITCNCKEYFYSPLNLYIADENSSSVYREVALKKQQIGILFTNKFCRQCHLDEAQMVIIISKLWKEYKIKIYRCQLPNNIGLQQQFNIKRFPNLHFVIPHHNSYLIYQNHQILTLSSAIKVAAKIKHSLQKYDLPQKQRNNAIFVNIQKLFFAQDEQMIDLYSLNPVYLNLPFLVFLQDNGMQNMLNHDKINEHEMSSCLIYVRRQGKCFSPTSLHQVAFVFSLINYQQAIEFNEKTYKSYQQLSFNRYIFIAVLDSIFKRQHSQIHKEMLNKILLKRQFRSKITIFWMETQLNKQKLTHLGFKPTDHPPLFSQFDLTNAPKKILKDKKGNPIFNELQITKFIKDIIKFDETEQLKKWNKQLLEQSLQRLKVNKQYRIINLKDEVKSSTYFILSFPQIELQLLGDNKIFYKMILNYRYLIQRINRFASIKIEENYLTFDKYTCNTNKKYGLFFQQTEKCIEISNQIIFDQQTVSKVVQSLLDLPDFFWINQDDYQSYLFEQNELQPLSNFEYIYIDV